VVDGSDAYRALWWLPGGHLQTIYGRLLARNYGMAYRRERWPTSDGDFIELDWLDSVVDSAHLLVLFHGLEGCSHSHYALALMEALADRGWSGVVARFRGRGRF
jgi:predicted alpha/beta-fold hydrolase